MGWAIRGAAACASRSRNGTWARRLYAVGEGSPAASGGDAGLQAIRPLLPPVCCNYCRSTFGHIDRHASSHG
jgi:hypothetical protein